MPATARKRKTPAVQVPPVFDSLDSYMQRFAPDLAARLNNGVSTLFTPGVDAMSQAVLNAISEGHMRPYPAQAAMVEAVYRLFRENHGRGEAWVCGEQGSGKTPIACWIIHAFMKHTGKPQRVVLTCPNHLVQKWARHVRDLIPGARAVVLRNWTDVLRYKARSVEITKCRAGHAPHKERRWLRPTHTEVLILPRDRGKLGYSWTTCAIEKIRPATIINAATDEPVRVEYRTFECPRCGVTIKDKNGEPVDISHWLTKNGRLRARQSCKSCGEQLWCAFNGKRGKFSSQSLPLPGVQPRRVAPCDMLKRMGVEFDFYIADEAHENKGGGSLQGQMFADLSLISKRTLMMTGTLIGGYAENLMHLFWRTCPGRMVQDDLRHDEDGFSTFVNTYGVLQRTKRYTQKNPYQSVRDLILGRGKLSSNTLKSLPGISPILFTNHLMDRAAFLRIMEMHSHLPTFDERIHAVQLDPDQSEIIDDIVQNYKEHRKGHKACRAWSAMRAFLLRWPDKPWMEPYQIMDEDNDGMPIPYMTTPTLPKREFPKERRVRRIVRRNMLRGRKTWVFTELTGQDGSPAWDWMDYLASYLRSHGVRVAVLRSTNAGGPKPEEREEWIAQVTPLVDVVISHPGLVQTGLDLYAFPSLVFAFCGDSTYRLRQASRRAWRLGQNVPCEVDYIVYTSPNKSLQEIALGLMADKMRASLAIEGDFSSEGLAKLGSGSDDISTQLAKFIDGKLNAIDDTKTAFAKYREQLMRVLPELGASLPEPGSATTTSSCDDDDNDDYSGDGSLFGASAY